MADNEIDGMVACPACGSGNEIGQAACSFCGFDMNRGPLPSTEEKQLAKTVLKLARQPVPLKRFKQEFPYLNQDRYDTDYVRIMDQAMAMEKSIPMQNLLGSFPRTWAIQKVGLFRRFLTLFIDWPLCMALFLGGLVMIIGSAAEPGLVNLQGGAKATLVWCWFFLSYFLYFSGTEYLLGTTVGGRLLGTRVVDEFGNSQGLGTLLKRNTYKLVPLIGPYALAPYVKPDHEVVKS